MEEPVTEQQTLRLMRSIALAMFGVGGVACAAGAVLKPLTPDATVVQLGAAAGFALWWLVVLLVPPRRRVLEAAALTSVALLSAIVAFSNVVGNTPFFFLWPLVYLAYFSSARLTAAGLGAMAITVGVACAVNPHLEDRVDTFNGTVLSVGLMAGLVGVMNRRETRLRAALADAANTDALTGLLNRRGFEPHLGALVAEARDAGLPMALVIFDLDHFKAYNDAHGHLGGDHALVRFADALRAGAPGGSRACRLGGEEFALALRDADAADAREVTEAILEALRTEPVPEAERFTASAGVCVLGDDVTSSDALLRFADIALYDAKAAGRDGARVWNDGVAAPEPAPAPRQPVSPSPRW